MCPLKKKKKKEDVINVMVRAEVNCWQRGGKGRGDFLGSGLGGRSTFSALYSLEPHP